MFNQEDVIIVLSKKFDIFKSISLLDEIKSSRIDSCVTSSSINAQTRCGKSNEDKKPKEINFPLNWQQGILEHWFSATLLFSSSWVEHETTGKKTQTENFSDSTNLVFAVTTEIRFMAKAENSICDVEKWQKQKNLGSELMKNSSSAAIFTSFSMSHMPLIIYCIFQCRLVRWL